MMYHLPEEGLLKEHVSFDPLRRGLHVEVEVVGGAP
jgi:hypothetical protein